MPDLPDRLRDYITVAQRIEAFLEKYPEGSLQADIFELTEDRVVMRAYAYRTAQDERPGMGYSSMPIPAKNVMLRDSEIETCETSAWGRAIAALGFEVKKAVASQNEIDAKTRSGDPAAGKDEGPVALAGGDGSLFGTAQIGKPPSDFELRATPDGSVLSFRLSDGRKSFKVVAYDTLAEALELVKGEVIDQRVQVWGDMSDEKFTPKGTTKEIVYKVLTLHRIKTSEIDLPAVVPDTLPLFDPDAEGELDAALENVP